MVVCLQKKKENYCLIFSVMQIIVLKNQRHSVQCMIKFVNCRQKTIYTVDRLLIFEVEKKWKPN